MRARKPLRIDHQITRDHTLTGLNPDGIQEQMRLMVKIRWGPRRAQSVMQSLGCGFKGLLKPRITIEQLARGLYDR